MNIHFSEEMMLYHHNFLHDSITENEKNLTLIFMQNKVNLFSLYRSPKMGNYVYYDIFQGYIFNYICQNFIFLDFIFMICVTWWHHHFTQMNIHIDWSRSVFRIITSIFSWFLYHFVGNIFFSFLWIQLFGPGVLY